MNKKIAISLLIAAFIASNSNAMHVAARGLTRFLTNKVVTKLNPNAPLSPCLKQPVSQGASKTIRSFSTTSAPKKTFFNSFLNVLKKHPKKSILGGFIAGKLVLDYRSERELLKLFKMNSEKQLKIADLFYEWSIDTRENAPQNDESTRIIFMLAWHLSIYDKRHNISGETIREAYTHNKWYDFRYFNHTTVNNLKKVLNSKDFLNYYEKEVKKILESDPRKDKYFSPKVTPSEREENKKYWTRKNIKKLIQEYDEKYWSVVKEIASSK